MSLSLSDLVQYKWICFKNTSKRIMSIWRLWTQVLYGMLPIWVTLASSILDLRIMPNVSSWDNFFFLQKFKLFQCWLQGKFRIGIENANQELLYQNAFQCGLGLEWVNQYTLTNIIMSSWPVDVCRQALLSTNIDRQNSNFEKVWHVYRQEILNSVDIIMYAFWKRNYS